YIRANAQGQVTDFFVMVRPLKALTTLAKAIGVRMRAAGAPPAPSEEP
ncbi:MAG: nuclear transport factor 2 family protein, partial [Pyrinomonadaceae bacterium]|nr:nuclear transport factor 2 family protein [Pyrinomonadaceae bacterium]